MKIPHLNSIKSKLLAGVCAACIIPYLLGGLYIERISVQRAESNYIQHAQETMGQIQQRLDKGLVSPMVSLVNMIAHDERTQNVDQSINNYTAYGSAAFAARDEAVERGISRYFETVKESHDNVGGVFMGTVWGGYMEYPRFKTDKPYDPRQRPWYKAAMEHKGQAFISDPYITATTQQTIVSVLNTIERDHEQVAVVGLMLNITEFQKEISAVKIGKTGYLMVLNPRNKIVVSPIHPEWILRTPAEVDLAALSNLEEKAGQPFSTIIDGKEQIVLAGTADKNGWKVVSLIDADELAAESRAIRATLCAVYLITLAFILLAVAYMAKRIMVPVSLVAEAGKAYAAGDLRTQIQHTSPDEMGNLAESLRAMRNHFVAMIRSIKSSAEHLTASAEELRAGAEQSAQAANQVSAAIVDVAAGAAAQAKSVDETTVAVEQMAAEIQQVAANAAGAAATAEQAFKAAHEGGKAVDQATGQMNSIESAVAVSAQVVAKLGERSKEIGQIVDAISGIAGQTNLLALNAAIEAARAGEQGKGFAVVAEEVRKLAEQSQTAAKQIAALISEIQTDTDKAVSAMDQGTQEVRRGTEVVSSAGKALADIQRLVEQVSGQVGDASAHIKEMAGSSQCIVSAVKAIDQISKDMAGQTGTVSAATEEQSASMEEIAASSEELAKMAEELQTVISRFKV